MWPFGKKNVDYDGLALELVQKASEYQGPTVDGIHAFLQGTDPLQHRDQMVEKKLLNAASAVVAAEHYIRDVERESDHVDRLMDAFYGYVTKLVGMNAPASVPRVAASRTLAAQMLVEAGHRFPARVTPSSDATHERLTYEMVRAVIRLHVLWAKGNASDVDLPTAHRDWKALSEAASGYARASRWIDTTVGPKIRKAMAE